MYGLQVYDLLDMDKDNRVTFDVIKASYDVQNHPLVLAKERSPQQVCPLLHCHPIASEIFCPFDVSPDFFQVP